MLNNMIATFVVHCHIIGLNQPLVSIEFGTLEFFFKYFLIMYFIIYIACSYIV